MPRFLAAYDGFSIKEIARLCKVSERTARRWKDGTRCPSPIVLMLLSADLGIFSDYWRGWVIRGERLISPEGWTTTRGETLSVQILHQQIAVLKAELRKATETLALEEQPAPLESIPDILG